MALLDQWSEIAVPVIGMLHAPPLPGSPRYGGSFDDVLTFVLNDAESLCEGGADGLMLENFGDVPFFPGRVPSVTVAAVTALACAVRQKFDLPLGINMLRNDGCSALSVALVCGAAYIRINVLSGARVTDQGLVQGIAHEVLRERAAHHANAIRILADVDVKHSAPLAASPIDAETRDLVERGLADAVIVSGQSTGQPTDVATVARVHRAASPVPVLVGSGVTIETAVALIHSGAAGLIVGSSLKRDRLMQNPIDPDRVRDLVQVVRSATNRPSPR